LKAPKLDTPIRLADVLELQGVEPTKPALKRLRRQIAAREQELGTRLILRPSPGAPYRTSLSVLREFMPELFPQAQDNGPAHKVFRALQDEVDGLWTALRERDETIEGIQAELAELRERDEILLSKLSQLKTSH